MNSVIFKPSSESPPHTQFSAVEESPATNYKHDIVRSFRMHRTLALTISVVIFIFLAVYAFGRHPYYETSALVYVQPMKARVITDPADGSYDPIRYDSYIQQQIQTIHRTDTLTDALKDATKTAPHNLWALPGEPMQSTITRLQKTLKVERETGSYQLSISLGGSDPRATAALLNAVVENYIEKERADELAQNDQQLHVLREDRARILEQLDYSTHEQARLSSSLGVADPAGTAANASSSTSSSNPFDSQLAQLRSQLADARAASAIADAQLASVSGKSEAAASPLDSAAAETYTNDPGLNALKQTISQRRSALATQMAGLTPKNPLYKQDQDELKRLDQSLDSMSDELRGKAAQQVLGRLQLEASRKQAIEARLASELQRQTAIATGATPTLQHAASVTADVARLQTRFNEVDNTINTLELEHDSLGLVHLLLPADSPAKPQTSKKWLILAAALPFGFGCGLAVALLLYKLDQKIYLSEDVSPVLSFPPMAVLPNPTDVDDNVMDEFMLRLVAGIDQAHSSASARTYLFSAISPNTNITDLVATLASKMGRLGYRTMILKASAALHSPPAAEADVEELKEWDKVQLAALSEVRPPALRRGSLIAENLEKLTQNVDLVFIEALPLLSSAEAEFAARLADITILIAESAVTTRRELISSLALVRRLNVAGIATVLAGVNLRHADEQFLTMVQSVMKRRFGRRHPEKISVYPDRDKYPLDIPKTSTSIAPDRDTRTAVKEASLEKH